jgi:hypothetical protein
MSEKINLTARIADLSKTVNFEDFYNVNIDIHRSRIILQGHMSPMTIDTAKKLNVLLKFDNETGMLIGESDDEKLRIVLT